MVLHELHVHYLETASRGTAAGQYVAASLIMCGAEAWVVKWQVRAFVKNKEGLAKQELNQSPLPFVESAAQPGAWSLTVSLQETVPWTTRLPTAV